MREPSGKIRLANSFALRWKDAMIPPYRNAGARCPSEGVGGARLSTMIGSGVGGTRGEVERRRRALISVGFIGMRADIMNGMETVTRLADVGDLDRAAEVLGDAFADYPWTRWTVDPFEHRRRIIALQRIALEHFAFPLGAVSVSTIGGEIQSVAAWSDSAAMSVGAVDRAVLAHVAELEGSRHDASKSAERQVERLRPKKRHLFLGTVGTTREMQGRGLATKTLAPLLQAGDDNALEVWLETSSESNVSFYRRRGFEVEGHLVIQGGGPVVWAMSRQPVTGGDRRTD